MQRPSKGPRRRRSWFPSHALTAESKHRAAFPKSARNANCGSVFSKFCCQRGGGFVVGAFVAPILARMEELRRNVWTIFGYRQSKDALGLELRTGRQATQSRFDKRTRVGERNSFTDTVLPSDPAGVDQPAFALVLANSPSEHFRILARPERQKWRTEATSTIRLCAFYTAALLP